MCVMPRSANVYEQKSFQQITDLCNLYVKESLLSKGNDMKSKGMSDSLPLKQESIRRFQDHVSSGKTEFFQKYEMDIVMGRREGPYLWDMDGEKKLFNLHCNGGVFNLGHRNQELTQLLNQSLETLDIGNGHLMSKERADLAFLLANLMPEDLDVTIFGVSGGEAVDVAFKIARAYTGRTRIISVLGGYHGHTGLAMAAGDEKYRAPFGPQLPGFMQVPFGDFKSTEYLQSIRNFCDEKNIILIIDEVQTGLGRTGKLWGFEHFDIVPDIVVLGKGLSGGIYPITATVIRKPMESVFHDDPFIHVSTFGGAELGCRVALRVLEISSASDFLNHVNQLAEVKSGL